MNTRNVGLDSLRGMAITLIVMSHCGILSQGGLGNAIFFTLSGFLAMIPFDEFGERKFLSLNYIGKYYLNRVIRIFPVLWVVLLGVWLLLPRSFFSLTDLKSFNSLVLNMLLYKAKNHLWFLQQEIFFYMVLPIIMILINFFSMLLHKKVVSNMCKHYIIGFILVAASLFLHKYRSVNYLYLWGNWEKQYFRLDQFLVGAGAAYIYKAICDNKKIRRNIVYQYGCTVYGILFILFCVFSSNYFLGKLNDEYVDYLIGWEEPMMCSILSGACILAILLCEKNWFYRIFENKLLVYVGKISFVIYLIHWFLIPYFEQFGVMHKFLFVYVISIGVSIMIHTVVEKPAIILAKTLKIKDVRNYYRELGKKLR